MEAEESSLQLFGQEYFYGETLDSAVSRGACDAEQWMAAVNTAMAALENSACSSSLEAYDREVKELKDGVLSLETFSLFDKQVLQDWIFPILFDAGRKTPMRARWTNGVFYGANILRNAQGDIRLVDCEFAHITHFFQTDSSRLREFSVLPSELGTFPLAHPTVNMPTDELHFWLQHLQMLQEVVRPEFYLGDVPTILERVLTLASQVRQERSQIQAVWSAAVKHSQSVTVERDVLSNERDALRRQTIESGERIAKLETDVEQLKIARIEATRECQSMRASLSWKLTWPLRALRDTIETISNKAKNRLPG